FDQPLCAALALWLHLSHRRAGGAGLHRGGGETAVAAPAHADRRTRRRVSHHHARARARPDGECDPQGPLGPAAALYDHEFNGDAHFIPWWDPRGACDANCSFVAGEGASSFWTLAPAALVPPPWRAFAYGAALAFGGAVSALRIAVGAHFFSDAAFAGVF